MASAYSPEQISTYLDYIKLPSRYHPSARPLLDLSYLTTLHVHQISTIPYENLQLHYSKSHRISLDPQWLFQKFIKNGRGGYCMETSIFYNHVLRALGFDVYTAGVKIRLRENNVPHGDYIGWSHIVNIVTLDDGAKYMVDVGFGGDGATIPVPLVDGLVHHNLGTQDIRLIKTILPFQTKGSLGPRWVYQYRNGADQEWNSYYAFAEFEFTEPDFEVMNCYVSTMPGSFQTRAPVIVLFLRRKNEDAPGNEEIYGKVMLANNVVKRNLGGKTDAVLTCRTEPERVKAVKDWFGIDLTEGEAEGIRGTHSELPWE